MVGCRNEEPHELEGVVECIKCSDGGVSEQQTPRPRRVGGVYQVFRWWGVGTAIGDSPMAVLSVSSVPMVGCRNCQGFRV